MPNTCAGEPGTFTGLPPSRTYTPPVILGFCSSPNPATKTCPAPKANAVGVGTPRATTVAERPATVFGDGGGPFGFGFAATAPDAVATAAANATKATTLIFMRPPSVEPQSADAKRPVQSMPVIHVRQRRPTVEVATNASYSPFPDRHVRHARACP